MGAPIHFIGLLRSPVSWARVGRELVKAFAEGGAHVSAVSLKGYLYDERFALDESVRAAIARERLDGWDLALDYPPNFARLKGKRRAGVLIYEADRFPPHWAQALKALDVAFVPSRFCLEAAAAAGVPREMLAVTPFGVNTKTYKPRLRGASTVGGSPLQQATGRAFNFLTVAAPHIRKGLAETVEAFCMAFGPADDVGLVLKCPPIARLGGRPWEYARIEDFLPDSRDGQIALVAETLNEAQMVGLYRGADVYVQASYGEGFGLALLEAAACGTPVITTNWGAAVEIFDEASAWLVDYDLVDASRFAYDWPKDSEGVRMARPRVTHLAEVMRRAYEDAGERGAKAAAGLAIAREMTWARAAEAVTGRLGS
jgi:glycosyltransferase involved in cell wall biosynthesis